MGVSLRLQPVDGSEVATTRYLRMYLMGAPKIGKSSAVLMTCPKPCYVINSDRDDSLTAPTDLMIEKGLRIKGQFSSNLIHSDQDMESALKLARHLVLEKGYKTIYWDTITGFSEHLFKQCEKNASGGSAKINNWTAYREFKKRILNFAARITRLPAHVIVASHYEIVRVGEDDDDDDDKKKMPKSGEGVAPGIPGSARMVIGKYFADVVFMEKTKKGSRVFTTEMDGVWGPGCSSLPGVKQVPASISEFIKMKEARTKELLTKIR